MNCNPSAVKEFDKPDRQQAKKILDYLRNIIQLDDPRKKARYMQGNWRGYWRYRIGDYRVICDINDDKLTILALRVGHRKGVYKKNPPINQ